MHTHKCSFSIFESITPDYLWSWSEGPFDSESYDLGPKVEVKISKTHAVMSLLVYHSFTPKIK